MRGYIVKKRFCSEGVHVITLIWHFRLGETLKLVTTVEPRRCYLLGGTHTVYGSNLGDSSQFTSMKIEHHDTMHPGCANIENTATLFLVGVPS